MLKFKGGIKEAAKLLQALDPASRKKVIAEMIAKNPELTHEIENLMVTFEDLVHLTPSMMRDLMRKVDMQDFALAMRGVNQDFIQKMLSLVSTNIRKDMQEVLNGKPRPISKVQEAQEKIMAIVKPMVERGELVLSADDETYV
ncbi:hypothetical protein N9B72_01030 [Bacteriovoracaceae bacterium]|jgi:flagellar motor switch protein FliG|nr:hypothetical protein [Bacteriovoracaceae bacterium]